MLPSLLPRHFLTAFFLFAARKPTKIPKRPTRPFHIYCEEAAIQKIPTSIGKQPNLYNKYVPWSYHSSSNVALYLNKDSKFTGSWPYVLLPLSWGIWTASAESNKEETSEKRPLHPTIKKIFFNSINKSSMLPKAYKNLVTAKDAKDKFGNTALHLACLSGNVGMVTWLLDNYKIKLETKEMRYGRTPFLCAVEKGHLAIAKLLKQRGANIKAKNKGGNNALHLACTYSGSVDMVKWLLGEECMIDIETKGGKYENTPFLCAAEKGQLAIAKLLRQRGANINATDKFDNNALHLACSAGHVDTARWLLKNCEIDLEAKENWLKMTAFLQAANKGHIPILQLLTKNKANIHATDEFDNTALHLARRAGHVPTVKWLLENCNIDLEAEKRLLKMTVFLYAAENGQLKIAKLLEKHKANIHATDEFGNTALHLACSAGHVDMVTWLLENCGIDLEAEGFSGKTAFLQAAERGYLEILKLLNAKGANTRATDKNGNTALRLAKRNSNKGVTEYLQNLGLPEQHTTEYKDTQLPPFPYESRKLSPLRIE